MDYYERTKKVLAEFVGGRWDGKELWMHGDDGKPHAVIWLLPEGRDGTTWSNEQLPGADRYRWDGADPTPEKPRRVIYVPDLELVGS